MKKFILFISLFHFLFVSPAWAEEIALTLDDAISLALRNNSNILLKSEDVLKAKAQIEQARAGLLPNLYFTGGWQEIRNLYSRNVDTYFADFGASQTLYASGKIVNAIKVSEYNYVASRAVLDAAKLDTVLDVKRAFFTYILADKFAQVNKGIVENTQEHIDFLQARFSQGQSSESEVLALRSGLVNARQAYELSMNQKEAGEALLVNLLSLDKEVRIQASDPLTCDPKEVAYDETFLKAMQQRPELRQLEAQKKGAEKAVTVAKADARPSVRASWDYYSSSRTSFNTFATPGGKGWNDYSMVGVMVDWPIFDGWLTKSKVDQALVDLKEARLLKEKKVKDIALELKNSYLALLNAVEKIKSVSEETKVYEDSLSVLQEKYKDGVASLLDLHDAQLSREVAMFNQVQANYDYIVAKAGFERATGGL
jgi:outer membrane protein